MSDAAAWQFGKKCPDCGSRMVQFCPLCGVDLFTTSHGAVGVRVDGEVVRMQVCNGCGERLMSGFVPPFYQTVEDIRVEEMEETPC